MAITWITPAGSLGVITERVIQDIPLEATSNVGPITFSIIAGSLPRGLRIDSIYNQDSSQTTGSIKGSPVEVKKFTTSRFVVRATDGTDIEDRTFSLSVDGSDIPEWITKEGFLNVGPAESYFVLDNSRVEFQLSATDTDSIAGDTLEFYLVPEAGELPPGLSLSSTGLISGFTDPIFALEYTGFPNGGYDTAPMDVTPLDFVEAKSNGFDTYFYDDVTYDYSENSRVPRRLSRIYNFVIAVTDGVNTINRLFKIFVVTEEFLQADNSIVQVDTNVFQADSSSDRKPLWITESDLGRFRANNYITLFLDVYDPPTLSGTITYFLLEPKNDWAASTVYAVGDLVIVYFSDVDITKNYICTTAHTSTTKFNASYWQEYGIPPGLELDSITGELAGRVPYQAAVTKNYIFKMMAVNFPATLSYSSYTLQGDWNAFINYAVNDAVRYLDIIYICKVANKNKTPNTETTYWEPGVSTAEKIFTVDVIGEIESAINWVTESNLGTIKPNQSSRIGVVAESTMYGNRVGYEFVSGQLPPGLEFLPTGDIKGKVRQFADDSGEGLTRFYERSDSAAPDSSTLSRDYDVMFDSDATSFDKKFTFTIKARDAAQFAEVLRTFYITVISENTKTFANLYIRSFQSKNKRLAWYDFITDATIFTPNDIYRYGDTNFGIQTDLKMLVFAGIESKEAVKYVQAMSRNHYRKRLLFGDIRSAKAKDPITQETVYEVIYVNIVDEYEKNGVSISQTVELPNNINSKVLISYDSIKVDSDIPFVSDSDHQRVFPNSIKNMRNRISQVGDRDREFLPLWMRSIQDQTSYESGFAKALILCYTKPGRSTDILARINAKIAAGFDFKQFDFVADRYLIDIIDGVVEDKYLAFPQRGEKLP